MSDLPAPLGQMAAILPVRLAASQASAGARILFQPHYGAGVATGEVDPSQGRYVIEFAFETAAAAYELWVEFAAADPRPTTVHLDGELLFEGLDQVTGGWGEDAQAWRYQKTIPFTAGSHRLTLSRIGYMPHIRSVALLPVKGKAEPISPPPPPTRPTRPERTLVCILAQTRAHALTWPSFKRNVLDELNADLALALCADERYDHANPFWQHAQHRWAAPEYADFGDGFDEAQAWLAGAAGIEPQPWRHILRTGGVWLGAIKSELKQPGAGAVLIYIRWFLLHRIMLAGLLERYDRFVITRSDFIWACPHPPLSVLDPAAIWFPFGEFYGGLTDRHLVLSSADVPRVLNMIDDILLRTDDLMARLGPRPNFNIESYIYFHLRSRDLIRRTRLFPYVMFTVRDKGDPTSWAAGTWNDEAGLTIKYPSEYQLAKAWRERIATRGDWERLARENPTLFPPMW